LRLGAVAVVLSSVAGMAAAQGYPARTIRIIVAYPMGGGAEYTARPIALKLQERWGQPVFVESRSGGSAMIGTDYVAKSPPDGYTLLLSASSEVSMNVVLFKKMPYDPVRDLQPVTLVGTTPPLLLAHPSLPVKSVKELVALARERPGALNYSSAGPGTTQHLAGELFKLRTGTSIVHVPYKGSAPSITALLAAEVQLSFINPVAVGPHVKTGRLRALAVAAAKRTELMPEVPTMKEAGIEGVEVPLWYGLLAPSATPRSTVRALAAGVAKAAHSPDIRKRLLEQGAEPVGNTPEEFDLLLRGDVARWGEVVKVSGARAD